MSSFLSDLKATIAKSQEGPKPWGDINPLLLIGLSDTILNLGLNEQQLYSVVKSYGRQLTAQAHPDRKTTNISEETQRRIFEVFNTLDDFDHFKLALQEFRSLRAEDRRENRILHESLSVLKGRIYSLENEALQLKEASKKLEHERQEFIRLKQEEGLLLPGLRKQLELAHQRIEELQQLTSASQKTKLVWMNRFASTMTYLISLSGSRKSGVHFFDAQWIAVVSLQNRGAYPLTPNDDAWWKNFSQNKDILSLKIPQELILAQWKLISSQFGTAQPPESQQLPLLLSILKVDKGVPRLLLGDRATTYGGKIIGSINGNSYGLTRDNLSRKMESMEITRLLTPFLMPGGLLVSLSEIPKVKASWSTTCPGYTFRTKRIIVAVG